MIDKERIEKIADLSRLKLNKEEIEYFASSLGKIIEYIKQLEELDLKDVRPMVNVINEPTHFNQDEPEEFSETEKLIEQGPEIDKPFFVVPRILKN